MRAPASALRGKTRKGSPWLRTALVEAAHAATHTKDCYLSAQYHRLALRRGAKKATIAVGHTLLVIIYHVLAEEKDYEELGGNYFDKWNRQAVQKQLVRRLENREAGLRRHAYSYRTCCLRTSLLSTDLMTFLIPDSVGSARGVFGFNWLPMLPFFMGERHVSRALPFSEEQRNCRHILDNFRYRYCV